MLDGAAPVRDLVSEVARQGQTAVAVTDHGVLHGAYDLWKTCNDTKNLLPKLNEKFGVETLPKAIVGIEAYVTPGTSRHDSSRVFFAGPYGDSEADKARRRNDVSAGGRYTHMTLWAESNVGLHNLFWMQTQASKDSVFPKWARIDYDLMNQYHEGLIATTGCPSGAVQTYLRLGMYKEAVREASKMQDIFGKKNLYVEIMDHGIEFERTTREGLLKLADAIGAPIVATNDLHYTKKEDASSQSALLCVGTNNNYLTLPDGSSNPNFSTETRNQWGQEEYQKYMNDQFRFDGSGYYVKSAEQMGELFKELPAAIKSTVEIAERCNISFDPEMGKYMPHVEVPGEKSEDEYFRERVVAGLKERFPDGCPDVPEQAKRNIPEQYDKTYEGQLEYEVDTILQMGFPSYFLVVADFVNWAKDNGIFVGPGRGSAAGALISYSLKITDLDPIEHKLVFERFLNPERVSLPDIDVDFMEGGREQVVEYCAKKYGYDNVAQIITFGKILAKNALRDAARILGYDYNTGDNLSKAFPETIGQKEPLIHDLVHNEKHPRFKEAQDFRALVDSDEKYQKVVETAVEIEGLIRGWGVHASGVLVSDTPIPEVCPTIRRQTDGATITQFEAHGCEELGLVKMDFLGLKNLNTLKATLKNIEKTTGEHLDITKIPYNVPESEDDPYFEKVKKAYDLISRAETLGVFQLDGEGMRTLMKRMQPTRFDDISACIALFRPGPMGVNAHNDFADRKNGRQKITPIHPEVDEALSEILDDTYGLIVFQEQIQFAARKLANYTMGQADNLRRAMGKKIKSELDANYVPFSKGMRENGYSDAAIKKVWDVFVPFAEYAFNRAHTACYGMIAYQNAYLKANYPTEYMAGLLTTFENAQGKLAIYLAECARMGIKVEVPDVNRSGIDFVPDPKNNSILFGLGAVRNVGEGVAEEIIAAREEKGAFQDFNDFLTKVPDSVCNKRKVESLIKSGAFDKFNNTRRALLAIHSDAIDAVLPIKRKEAEGQFDLFSSLGIAEASQTNEKLEMKIPELPEMDRRTKLEFEKEMLGLYVSDHPLSQFAQALSRVSDFPLSALNDADSMKGYGTRGADFRGLPTVEVSGMVKSIQKRVSRKSGKPWAQIILEDLTGSANIAFFGKAYDNNIEKLVVEEIVKIKGRLEIADDGTGKLSASEVTKLDLNANDEIPEVNLKFRQSQCSPDQIKKLQEILTRYHGEQTVVLEVQLNDKKKEYLRFPDQYNVKASSSFYAELAAEFGKVY
jgi:DNA polymerase-3 subunit alpha